jgi:hypothetical protein
MDGTRPLSLLKRSGPRPPEVVALSNHRRGLKLFFCLLLLAGCGSLYLYSALSAPRRSPLIILSASYSPSWDLNPWGKENAGLMRQMDRRSLSALDAGDGTDMANGWWTRLDELVLSSLRERSDMPLLLYINLHGAVDDAGQPRLIPPQAAPYDPRTWISVWELLQHLDHLLPAHSTSVALFFESGRVTEGSPSISGELGFAQAMEKLLVDRGSELQFLNLHVMLSSTELTPSASDWSSGCDLFTRELARGLYGTADLAHQGGNQDGYVQFAELADFVTRQVGQWSQHHRGRRQSVWSWSQHSAATRLTWKLRGELQPPPALTLPTAQELEQIQTAWQQLSHLQDSQPWQAFPSQWRSLCDLALGYEQAVHGGQTARQQAMSISTAFNQQLTWLQTQISQPQLIRTLEQRLLDAQALTWKAWVDSPTLSNAQRLSQAADSEQTSPVAIVPLLKVLAEEPNHPCWNQTANLARYAKLRHQVAALQSTIRPDVQNYFQPTWEQLKQSERQIDDLFVADSSATQIAQQIDLYEQSVTQWRKLVNEYQRLYAMRDQLIAELPNLAECLLAVAHQGSPTPPPAAMATAYLRLEDQLQLLAVNTARICEALADPVQSTNWRDLPNFAGPLRQLAEQHNLLWENVLQHNLAPNATDTSQLEMLLSYTWLPSDEPSRQQIGKQRVQAWKRLRVWEHALATGPQEPLVGAKASFSSSSNSPPLHAFSRFLVACLTGRSKSDRLAPAALRNWLRLVAAPQLSQASDPFTADSLKHWRQLELETRLAAAVAGANDPSHNITTLRDLQATHRLLCFAQQTLDDFWAAPEHQAQPYFHWLASEAIGQARVMEIRLGEMADNARLDSVALLSAAINQQPPLYNSSSNSDSSTSRNSRLTPSDLTPLTFAQREQQLTALLQERSLVAREGLEVRPSWQPDLDASLMQADNQVTWSPLVEIVAKSNGADFPEGIAAVSIQDAITCQRQPLPLSSNFVNARVPFTLSPASDSNSHPKPQLMASLNFRGHRFPGGVLGVPNSGGNIRVEYPPPTPTSLTIYDKAQGARNRTFILDCSASMAEKAVGESNLASNTSAVAAPLNKLDAAKLALLGLLQDMRDSKDHVSVILYGHRIAQGSAEQGTLRQSKYLEKFPLPQAVEAYEDVETILPMGRFGNAEAKLVQERLEAIVPWGQTPLFLAVAQAVQANPQGTQPHDVIVISDGKNYQFNPRPEKHITADEVIGMAQAEKTTLHVIGFGVPEDQIAASTAQFEQLAHGTGGTNTMQIANASLLSQRLEELRTPSIYRVLTVDGSTYFGRANAALTLPAPRTANEQIAIEIRDKTYFVPLNLGTSLRMSLDSRGQLVLSDNNEASPSLAPLLDSSGHPSNLTVGVHAPQRVGEDMRWKLSLRGHEGQLVSRPQRMIVELQPSASDSTTSPDFPTYILAANHWSHESPQPTVEFLASAWPRMADRASLQVWIVEQTPSPIPQWSTTARDMHWQPLDGLEIRMHRSSQAVTAVIVASPGNRVTDWTLGLNSSTVNAAEHRFISGTNTSFHFFELLDSAQSVAGLEQGPAVRNAASIPVELISLTDLKQQALHFAKPMKIDIARPLTAIAPTPHVR